MQCRLDIQCVKTICILCTVWLLCTEFFFLNVVLVVRLNGILNPVLWQMINILDEPFQHAVSGAHASVVSSGFSSHLYGVRPMGL